LRLCKSGEFAYQNKAQNGPKVYVVNVADIWEESGYAYPREVSRIRYQDKFRDNNLYSDV